ncbi:SusC/RagA family TonB-linked outer membrane protein [Pedobacter heparinus]|uniref:SusC/RagA family TonB-linked outer membrane protein n=1 Tax=Pedobacter heparinus TaxID=984 RepID=UPI0029319F55|nr:SusC/RagA family TonB-linked outer membrane protein [Pedobacter heparinus]
MKKRLPEGRRMLFFLFAGLFISSLGVNAQAPAKIAKQRAGTSGAESRDSLPLTEIPLLFNIKTKASLNIASVQSISGQDLAKTPGNLLKGILAGRLAGLYINQSNGKPGTDGYSISLRGQNPMTVIDGVPQNMSFLSFNEIDSVTVLKDALATAMYGPQASNGVLLITTRKGEPGKQKISVTAQSSLQRPLKFLKGLGAYDYARLYNEALVNDNIAPAYTQGDLDAYRNHTDPYGHPDVNWQDEAFDKSTRIDQLSVNLSGGNQMARYFVAAEHLSQGGIFNTDPDKNSYQTNTGFSSYTVRSNVDINLDARTNVGLNVMGRTFETNEPGTTANTIISNAFNTPNNAYPIFNPDGSLGGNQQFQNNIYGQMNQSGYRKGYERNMLADLYLKRNFDDVLAGLWAKALISFSGTLTQNILRNKSFATYLMNAAGTGYTKYSNDGTQNNSSSVDNQWRQGYAEFDLGYSRNFGKNKVDALVLYSQNNNRMNSDLPLIYKGLSGRLAYNYDERYLAELTFGYNGANRYPEGFRYRLFPAAGLGWNIHEEEFMKPLTWLNRLKLFGSYGKTGNNRNGYYSFNQYFFDGDKVFFGTTPTSFITMDELVLSNPDLDYEKANKLNVGIEGALLKDRLSFRLEYYKNGYYDLLRTRGKSSTLIGNSYPEENIGKSRYTGLEMNLGWKQDIGSFSYAISNNLTIAKSKYVDIDEVYQRYDWMKRTGGMVGQAFGYTATGFFQTASDLQTGAAIEGYTPQLGDIMYKDFDGDGVITKFDEAPIGNTKPLLFFGTTLTASYKGFDLSALVQGAFNRNIVLTGDTEWEFQNGGFGQAYQQHLDRWIPGATNASYPRLTAGTNPNNHVASSSFWYHNGNYGRLKYTELGYTFASGWIKKLHLQSVRLFVSGTNLITISAYDRVDPEVNGGVYPIQRAFSGGLTINL